MTFKLNPGVKKAWIQALRSGEYKQGIGRLRGPQGFCCLGVLADCAGILKGDAVELEVDGRLSRLDYLHLPEDIMPIDIQGGLAKMNDGAESGGTVGQASFSEIADYIEEYL